MQECKDCNISMEKHDMGCCGCSHDTCSEQTKFMLLKIILTIVIFLIVALFLTDPVAKSFTYVLAYLIIGTNILSKAVKNIFKGKIFDENTLMSVATIGALYLGQKPEAVMVMLLYTIGEYLQEKAVEKSKKSISELMDLRPDTANVLVGDEVISKSPDEVNVGDIIVVKTGERVPLDGIVIKGSGFVDTSALTGETVPREVLPQSEVLSGCIVSNGYLKIKTEKNFTESTVSKILELVENAGEKKSKAENFITKFAKIYTPIVVLLAIGIAVVPTVCFHANFYRWLFRAMTFLVISCPCALVISVPLGFFAGLGGASRKGILIKGGKYIEMLAKVGTVVFDKTGTVTKGNFTVEKVVPTSDISELELIKLAVSLETYSNHPVAKSVSEAYKGDLYNDLTEISEISGKGIKAKLNGAEILAGNDKFMELNNIDFEKYNDVGTVCYIAKDGKLSGFLVLNDKVKESSEDTISKLKDMGISTVMLSGDSKEIVSSIAEKLGIDKAYSELLPQAKVEKLEELLSTNSKKTVMFVGDGINDAPVLRRADVGVAMGGLGSDCAIEASDAVIMDDNPQKIVTAIKIARKTFAVVKQNIVFAVLVKVLFLILGACGLMTMWGAVFSDVGVTLIAILNSLRAFTHQTRREKNDCICI